MGHAAPVPDMTSSQVRDLSASHWRDLRQDKDAAIYWSEPSFQMKNMLCPGTTPHPGQLKISAPSFVAAEVATQRGHAVWIPLVFQQQPQPQQTPPACVQGKKVLADKSHRGVWAWTALALTVTSVNVRPRKPPASPAWNPNCSCCRPSNSPT